MNDISVLNQIALFHIYSMTFLLLLVIIYAIVMVLYIVLMLVKKKGIKIDNPLKRTVDETISTIPENVEITGGRVVKFKSLKERQKDKEKAEKRRLGLK